MQSYTLTNLLVSIRNNQAKDGQESTFYMTTPPLVRVRLLSLFFVCVCVCVCGGGGGGEERVWLLKRWKFYTIHLIHLTWVPVTSFYFQGLRKCFLEISIHLEVLLAALFISVSNRYQKKTTKVLQKVLSLGSDYFSATFYQTYFYYKPSK